MKNFKKAFLFEVKRIVSDKKVLWSFIIFLLLAISFLLAFRSNMSGTNINYGGNVDGILLRRQRIEQLRDFYFENYEGRYEPQPNVIPEFSHINAPEYKDFYYQKYQLYDFYLKNDTGPLDYIDTQNLNSNWDKFSATISTLYAAKLSYWVFLTLALFLTGYYFLSDGAKGRNKIIFASKIERKDMFSGKLCVCAVYYSVVFLISFLVGILPYKNGYAMYYNGTSYLAVNCVWVFIANMFHHATTLGLVFSGALYVGVKTKSREKACLPLCIFGLSFGLTWILYSVDIEYINRYGFWQPVSNTYFGTGNFWQPQFWIIAVLSLLSTALFFIYAKKEYQKGDIC